MIAANRVNLWTAGVLAGLATATWFIAAARLGPMAKVELSVPLYAATWLTMLVGMMFPAVAPVVVTFAGVARARHEATPTIVPAFVGGYVAIWTATGLIPLTLYLSTRGVVAGMSASPLGPIAIGIVLFGAGVYSGTFGA